VTWTLLGEVAKRIRQMGRVPAKVPELLTNQDVLPPNVARDVLFEMMDVPTLAPSPTQRSRVDIVPMALPGLLIRDWILDPEPRVSIVFLDPHDLGNQSSVNDTARTHGVDGAGSQEPVAGSCGGTDLWLASGQGQYAAERVRCESSVMLEDV